MCPLIVLAGCGDTAPVSEAVESYTPPSIETGSEGERLVRNRHAGERLLVRTELPRSGDIRLLFLRGRAATPVPGGGAAWADTEGARVVVFDRRGRVERVLQGGSGNGVAIAFPVAAIRVEGGFRVEERDGAGIFVPDDGPMRSAGSSPFPVVGGGPGVRLAARSVLYFPLAPVQDGDPLIWRIQEDGARRPLGRARPAETALLGELENTGWAAPAPDGGAYFAFAVRPEIARVDEDGRLLWRAWWPPERELERPAFRVENGGLRAVFPVVHHALVQGDDGLVYLLAASSREGEADRLLVFDDAGILVREAAVVPDMAIYADRGGRVHVLPEEDALSRTPQPEREAFANFELPALAGDGQTVRLEDYRGRVVVLNFWASWCPPCRREIPLLDELSRALEGHDAIVIGLNDDVRPAEGRAFLDELGGVSYPNVAGRGRIRREYGYRGLPYTVVLDRQGRVVRAFYGFGSSIDPIAAAVTRELARGAASRAARSH